MLLLTGNRFEPWGENPKFGSIFEVEEVRKCYQNLTIHESMEQVPIGGDVLGVYFIYPGDRDRDFKNIVPKGQSFTWSLLHLSKSTCMLACMNANVCNC